MRLLLIILMGLVVLLPSSSFFLPAYLTELIINKKHNQTQLIYAAKQNNVSALKFSIEQESVGSKAWLVLMTQLAKIQGEGAYRLGRWYAKKAVQIISLEKNVAAQNKAKMWFKQAMRLGSLTVKGKAQLALATLYFKEHDLLSAQTLVQAFDEWLTEESVTSKNLLNQSLNNEKRASLILQIKIAIALGQTELIAKKLTLGKTMLLQSVAGRLLLDDIAKFKVLFSELEKNEMIRLSRSRQGKFTCLSSLQLFASSLKHLKQLEQLQQKFTEKPLSRFICLETPRYLAKGTVKCQTNNEEAIQCHESSWQAIAESVESRHVGLMVEEGGANIHLGIMYLDSQDTVDVFSHEVSHLLGFVDEYPLVKSHQKCEQPQLQPFAHNIAVLNTLYYGDRKKLRQAILKNIPWANNISEQTPILQKVLDNEKLNNKQLGKKVAWRLGTPKSSNEGYGIFTAESCHNLVITKQLKLSAYKPIAKRTQLRYFASDFPDEYLKLLSDQPRQFLMPSFHYNLALSFYQQGDIAEAKYWLKQAASWEENPQRKEKIRQGAF
jgi:hypothetical protein